MVIVILDEYDTPMQEAWLAGNWEEAVAFFRGFLNAVFKTNPCMYRGIITGITRVSKESVFSDLNNLDVITTTSDEYARYFGFTEEEVFKTMVKPFRAILHKCTIGDIKTGKTLQGNSKGA